MNTLDCSGGLPASIASTDKLGKSIQQSDPEADTEESGDNFLSLGCRFLSFEGYTNCDCSGSHTLTAFLLYF